MKLSKREEKNGEYLVLWTREIRALEIHPNQIFFTRVQEDGELIIDTEPMNSNINYLIQEEKK